MSRKTSGPTWLWFGWGFFSDYLGCALVGFLLGGENEKGGTSTLYNWVTAGFLFPRHVYPS